MLIFEAGVAIDGEGLAPAIPPAAYRLATAMSILWNADRSGVLIIADVSDENLDKFTSLVGTLLDENSVNEDKFPKFREVMDRVRTGFVRVTQDTESQ